MQVDETSQFPDERRDGQRTLPRGEHEIPSNEVLPRAVIKVQQGRVGEVLLGVPVHVQVRVVGRSILTPIDCGQKEGFRQEDGPFVSGPSRLLIRYLITNLSDEVGHLSCQTLHHLKI